LYPQQSVSSDLAKKAQISTTAHEWDRHHYEPTLPGFGGSDSIDWRDFIETAINVLKYKGPFVIENEAALSKGTGNIGAMMQGLQATILNLSPLLWPLVPEKGYVYNVKERKALKPASTKDIPLVTMDNLK
jgi:hypothetical protein